MAGSVASSAAPEAVHQVADEVSVESSGPFAKLKHGLFGVSFVSTRRMEPMSPIMYIIGAAINLGQMLAFPLAIDLWGGDRAIVPVAAVIQVLNGSAFDRTTSPTVFRVLLGIAMVWAATLALMSAVVARRFVQNAPQGEVVARITAKLTSTSMTLAFLPITSLLLRSMACSPEAGGPKSWMETNISCGEGAHIAISVASAVLLLVFLLLTMFAALTFVDRSPASASWGAKVHGRVDAILLVIKLVLACLFNLAPEAAMFQTVALPLALAAAGSAWVYCYWINMPMVVPTMNFIEMGSASVLVWASLCLLAHQVQAATSAIAALVLVGSPLVFLAAYLLARAKYDVLRRQSYESLSTVPLLDLWARAKLREFLALRSLEAGQGRRVVTKQSLFVDAEQMRERWTASAARAPSKNSNNPAAYQVAAAHDGEADDAQMLGESASQASGDAEPRLVLGGMNQMEPFELPLAIRAWNALLLADKAYQRMQAVAPESLMGLVLAAGFQREFSPFTYGEMAHLSRVRRLHPPVDAEFWVFRRTRELREQGSGAVSTSRVNVIDRVMFDQYAAQALQLRQTSYRCATAVWEALADRVPDLATIRKAGMKLHRTLDRVEHLYRRMISLNPDATSALRGYATFLSEQRNDTQRAMELLNKANRIEEAHSRTRAKAMRHLVFGAKSGLDLDSSAERAAAITISCDSSNMGEILTVSQAACRLLNFTAPQLLGQNVATIVPQPFRTFHDRFLTRFASMGYSSIMNTTRMLFCSTSSSASVPIWMHVREAPPAAKTSAPRFSAVLQPIASSEEHILFQGSQHGYHICSCSAASQVLLGIDDRDPVEGDESINMLQFFPSLARDFRPEQVTLSPAQWKQYLSHAGSSGFSTAYPASKAAGQPDASPTKRSIRTSLRASLRRGSAMAGLRFQPLDGHGAGVSVEATRLQAGGPPRLVPVRDAADSTTVVVGSLQRVVLQGIEVFSFGWHRLGPADGDVGNRRQSHELLEDGSASNDSSREAWADDDSDDEHVRRRQRHGPLQAVTTPVSIPAPHRGADKMNDQERERLAQGLGQSGRHLTSGRQAASLVGEADGSDDGAEEEGAASSPSRSRVRFAGTPTSRGRRGSAAVLGSWSAAAPRPGGSQDEADGENDQVGEETGGGGKEANGEEEGDGGSHAVQDGGGAGQGDQSSDGEGAGDDAAGEGGDNQAVPGDQPLSVDLVAPQPPGQIDPIRVPPAPPKSGKHSLGPESRGGRAVSPGPAVPARRHGRHGRHGDDGGRAARRGGTAHGSLTIAAGDNAPRRMAPALRTNRSKASRGAGGGAAFSGRASEQSGGTTASRQLGRALKAQKKLHEPEVWAAWYATLASLVFLTIVAAASVVAVNAVIDHVQRVAKGLSVAGSRQRYYASALYSVARLVGLNAGLGTENDTSLDYVMDEIRYYGDTLQLYQEDLQANGPSYGERAHSYEANAERLFVELRAVLPANGSEAPAEGGIDLQAVDWIGQAVGPFFLTDEQIADFFAQDPANPGPIETINRFTEPLHLSPDPAAQQLQLQVLNAADSVSRAYVLPIAEMSRANEALLHSIAQLDPTEATPDNLPIRTLFANSPVFKDAANVTTHLRMLEIADVERVSQQVTLISGSVVLGLLVVVNLIFMRSMVRKMNERTREILRLLLIIPPRVAERLRLLQQTLLHRLAMDAAGGDDEADDEDNKLLAVEDEDEMWQQLITAAGHLPSRRHKARLSIWGRRADEADSHVTSFVQNKDTGRWTVNLRSHADTSPFVLRSTLLVLSPSIVVFFWLMVVVLVISSTNQRVQTLATREALVTEAMFQVMSYMTAVGGLVYIDGGREQLREQVIRMQSALDKLTHTIVAGGEVFMGTEDGVDIYHHLPGLGSTDRTYKLAVIDGCAGMSDEGGCRAVETGKIGEGLMDAFAALTSFGANIVAALPAPSDDPHTPLVDRADLRSLVTRMEAMVDPHMIEGLTLMQHYINDDLDLAGQHGRAWMLMSALAAIGMCGLVAVMVVAPALRGLATPLHSARALLPLIPEGITVNLPPLRRAIRDIAASENLMLKTVGYEPRSKALINRRGWARVQPN